MIKLTKQQIILIVLMVVATICALLQTAYNLYNLFARTIYSVKYLLAQDGYINSWTTFILVGDILNPIVTWVLYGIAMWLLITKFIKSLKNISLQQ